MDLASEILLGFCALLLCLLLLMFSKWVESDQQYEKKIRELQDDNEALKVSVNILISGKKRLEDILSNIKHTVNNYG